MAITIEELVARVSADTRDFRKGMSEVDSTTSKTVAGVRKGALIMGGALIAGGGMAVKAASDLGEQQSKARVVFGKSSSEMIEWSGKLAKSNGLSSRAALEAAGTYGNMLVPMGIARDRAAQMSQKMVGLAGDMASFNNASPDETLDAIRAGLAGETEPLRRFGVFLNEARIQHEAFAMGLVDGKKGLKAQGGQLTASQKALASYSIIMKDTKDTQGDFARTGNSLPNQMRTFRATTENLAASLGQMLLPAVTKVFGVLLSGVDTLQRHQTATKLLIGAVAGLTVGILAVSAAYKLYSVGQKAVFLATKAYTAVQWLLNAALTANPIGLIVVGLAALGVSLVIAWKKSDTFRRIVTGSWEKIQHVAEVAFEIIKKIWRYSFIGMLITAGQHFDDFRDTMVGVWNGIKSVFATAISWIAGKFLGFASKMLGIAGSAFGWVPGLGGKIDGARRSVDNIHRSVDEWARSMNTAASSTSTATKRTERLDGAMSHIHDKNVTITATVHYKLPGGFKSDAFGRGGDVSGADLANNAPTPSITIPSGARSDVNSALWPAMGLASSMGLHAVSTYRPGAIVRGTNSRSDHSIFPSKAVDEAGSPFSMSRYAMSAAGMPGVETVIYSGLGRSRGIWTASRGWHYISSGATYADHFSHVHVDTFDQGGFLKPGTTIAMNKTGRPELILPPISGSRRGAVQENHYHIAGTVIAERELLSLVRNGDARYSRVNRR